MITRICMGYVTEAGATVPCGKLLGYKPGPDGVSHGWCDGCAAKMDLLLPNAPEKTEESL